LRKNDRSSVFPDRPPSVAIRLDSGQLCSGVEIAETMGTTFAATVLEVKGLTAVVALKSFMRGPINRLKIAKEADFAASTSPPRSRPVDPEV
jgi:hypothetical protein